MAEEQNNDADTRRVLIVNLSGDQKNVLGFASWTQVTITAVGIGLGIIIYTLMFKLLTLFGISTGVAIIVGAIMMAIVIAPFIYLAFFPVRDKDGHIIYYKNKQLMIDYFYNKQEKGTYLNIQPKIHSVNANLPYRPKNR